MRWLTTRLRENLSLDLRALALMRITFAALIAIDLVNRSDDIVAHYSDEGWLPRDQIATPLLLRLFCLRGDPAFVTGMFIGGGVLAFALLIGFRSRLVALCCYLFMGSLHARNWLVIQGGDDLMRNLLLFLALAPIGSRWSLDAWLARRSARPRLPTRLLDPTTVALYGQLFHVYFIAGLMKAHFPHWWRGEAVYQALGADHLATGIGRWLFPHWYVLKAATYGTLALELIGPFLLLLGPPRARFRLGLIAVYVALHLGIAATIHIGLFSAVSIACWVFTLPPEAMDRVARFFGERPKAAEPPVFRWGTGVGRALPIMATVLFGYLVVASVFEDKMFEGKLRSWILTPGDHLALKRRWELFVTPRETTGWYILYARTFDRRDIDLMKGGAPLSYERPALFYGAFANQRWRKMLTQLPGPKKANMRELYLRWLCRQHRDVRSITFIYMKRTLGAHYDDGPIESETVGAVNCVDKTR